MKINYCIALGGGPNKSRYGEVFWKWKAVAGTLADVAPHLTLATFAVHKTVHELWVVSCLETGQYAASGLTEQMALQDAAEKLSLKTDADIAAIFSRFDAKRDRPNPK